MFCVGSSCSVTGVLPLTLTVTRWLVLIVKPAVLETPVSTSESVLPNPAMVPAIARGDPNVSAALVPLKAMV